MIKIYFLFLFIFITGYTRSQNLNLIVNGDLSHGTKIKSDLIYSYTSVNPGTYTISKAAEYNNAAFVTPPKTSGSFLIADMSEEDIGKRIWYATIPVDTGKTYLLSFQAANIHRAFTNPSVLRITVNGKNVSKLFRLSGESHDWMTCSAYYTNGNRLTEITVAIENNIFVSEGNDVALSNFSTMKAENIYLKYSKASLPVTPKKDSLPLPALGKKDSATTVLKEPEIILFEKDSVRKAPGIPSLQTRATQKTVNPSTDVPQKKERKAPENLRALKPGDGVRAPKETATAWIVPERMSIPKKDPPAVKPAPVAKKTVSTPEKKSQAVLLPQKTTAAKITKKDSLPRSKKIPDSLPTEHAFDQPPIVGEKIRLGEVYFEQGTCTLTAASFPELNTLFEYLKVYPSVRIRLEGHTDTQGDSAKNMLLSEQRVQYLKQYLVDKGIEGGRIEWKGFGSSKPLNSNRIEGLRKLNRRVEVVLLSK